jgi:hypothetical protein
MPAHPGYDAFWRGQAVDKILRLPLWPEGCASGCRVEPTPFYLAAGGKAGFAPNIDRSGLLKR